MTHHREACPVLLLVLRVGVHGVLQRQQHAAREHHAAPQAHPHQVHEVIVVGHLGETGGGEGRAGQGECQHAGSRGSAATIQELEVNNM